MGTVIDFHSHILPGIDDGSESVEQSVQMLQREMEQGIRHVVATPHFYPRHDKPEAFLAKRAAAEQALRQALEKHPELPRVSIGAEVYYFNGIGDSNVLSELTVDKTGFVLIEMPMPPWSERNYRDLENIYIKQNLVPIVAHMDRYIRPFHTYKIPERLEKLPVLVQANAEFFIDKTTRRMALQLLQRGQLQLLGSDCHNLTDRAPNWADALQIITQKLGEEALSFIRAREREIFE